MEPLRSHNHSPDLKAPPSLVLYPVDTEAQPPVAHLTAVLAELGLLGEQLAPERFATGNALWDYLCLLGCAPVWQQTPEIYLHSAPVPCFWLSSCMPPPRCPWCKARMARVPEAVHQYAVRPGDSPVWHCAACSLDTPAAHWLLGRYALYARSWIALSPVYPGEAVPAERLLARLTEPMGSIWEYAYCGLCQREPHA